MSLFSQGEDAFEGEDAGTWYEFSRAAAVLGIDGKALKQRIKADDLRLKKDRNQSQPAPFGAAVFVYVAGEGRNASKDMSINLTEWLRLCKLMNSGDEKVSFGEEEKEIHFRYTGSRCINPTAMRDSNRFISSAALTSLQRKKEQKSETKEGATKQSHQDDQSSSCDAKETTKAVAQPVRECKVGIDSKSLVDYPCKVPCLEKFDYCKQAWRSKDCLLSTHSADEGRDPNLWVQNADQCMKCVNAKSNLSRTIRNFECTCRCGLTAKTDAAEDAGPIDTSDLISSVVRCYQSLMRGGDASTVAENQLVAEYMLILQRRGTSSVDCEDGNVITICAGADELENRCGVVSLLRKQSNNSGLCERCRQRKKRVRHRDDLRERNHDVRVDPKGSVPVTALSPEELQERTRRANRDRKVVAAKQAKERLKKAFDVEVAPKTLAGVDINEDDEFQRHSLDFMEEIKRSLLRCSAGDRRAAFKKAIGSTLIEVLKEGITSEQNDPSKEFDEADVVDLVDLVTEQIDNAVQKHSGKPGQIRHSPMSYQIAWATYKRSKAGFREANLVSPLAMPHIRELGRLKSVSKVEDGKDSTIYETRLRVKKERAAKDRASTVGAATSANDDRMARSGPTSMLTEDPLIREDGLLMVDEIKVKHGMVFNSKTLEPLGMANDDLDMKTVLRNVLSGDNDFAKPAVYISQWRYKSIATNEAWNCSYFMNDGSCTGETLLRQMQYVTTSCESISSLVHAVCFDAGGNNARLMRISRNGKTLTEIKLSWIDDDLCHIKNEFDPKRRVYLYFCSTHQLKAMRNQLIASVIGGAKAFRDANGIPFGWNLIRKLKVIVENLDGDIDFLPRITDAVTYPTKYSKMSVSDAKKPFELKTLAFLEQHFCNELEISIANLDIDESNLVSKYIQEHGNHSPTLKHGRMYYRAQKIMSIALSRRGGGVVSRDETDAAAMDQTGFEPANDTNSSSASGAGGSVSEELLSDIASFVYLAAVGTLFNGMLSDTKERFNKNNIGPYTNVLKDVMKYFEKWKEAQILRKEREDEHWQESFLDSTTYNNLRSCICGFVHFCTYVLENVSTSRGDKLYIPMMFSNQTSLEGFFSVVRGGNYDTATKYGSNINTDTASSALATMPKSSYDVADRGKEFGGGVISGMTAYKSYHKGRNDALNRWKKGWEGRKDSTSSSLFPLTTGNATSAMSSHAKRILSKMEETPNKCTNAIRLFDLAMFQSWMRLSIGTHHESFFHSIIKVSDAELDKLCQNIHMKLFGFIDAFILNSTDTASSFESQLRQYLVSDSFHDLYTNEFPAICGSRYGALIIVRSLAEIHESLFFQALRRMYPYPILPGDGKLLTSEDVNQLVHRFGGAAVRVCFVKFRKPSAKVKYGRPAASNAKTVLSSMRLESLSAALSDDDYMQNYYPPCIQHFNQGGLSLLKKDLFPWAQLLIRKVWSSLPDSAIASYKKDSIKKAAEIVYGNEAILSEFIKCTRLAGCPSAVPDDALKVIHAAIVEYVFLAYAGMRWDNKFGKDKKKSGSVHNVGFRTVLQCGAGGGDSKSESGNKRGSKRRRGPNPNVVEHMAKQLQSAHHALKQNGNCVETDGSNKLTKIQMSSLIYFCYGEYVSANSNNATQLKEKLAAMIVEDASKLEKASGIDPSLYKDKNPQRVSKQQRLDAWNVEKSLDKMSANTADANSSSGNDNEEEGPTPMEDEATDGEEYVYESSLEEDGTSIDVDEWDTCTDDIFLRALENMPMPC